ncbi:MAG: aminotransferase class I and II [Archangium gephyra]|uniref:Aminotransferase class I and II n=1 Tax=Archangium gephyra TaxID=48 RepID=A0A2W5TSK1_9BACT|nr:MAG: aminotransferase class I and II [Archangium gephyra]
MKSLTVTRYVRPLREGGSLPAIVEASDDGLYVAKFRGAGQGKKALLAEIICGGLGKALGLPVPEVVLLELDPKFGRNEPHDEIRDLLNASAGLNVGLDYLPGSITFDPLVRGALTDELASKIVAFDALTLNVDRTAKNPNLLSWHKHVWLIDHGAALYFHHGWGNPEEAARSPFAPIRQHVLLPFARDVEAVRFKLSSQQLDDVLAPIPDEWLENEPGFATANDVRAAYKRFFEVRLANQALFLEEASRARAQLV